MQTVEWIIGINARGWAFGNLMSHFTKALPGYQHRIIERASEDIKKVKFTGDIIVAMHPENTVGIRDKRNVICRIDGLRMLGL